MYYIQRKDCNGLETVDEVKSKIEARRLVKEYASGDSEDSYYISTRSCKDWRYPTLINNPLN